MSLKENNELMKISRISRYLLLAGVCLFLMFSHGLAVENTLTALPERIVLNLTRTPYNSQAITWRTRKITTDPRVQIVRASELLTPENTLKTFPARTTIVDLDKETTVYHHSVILNSLEPNILYAYRAGGDSCWSEWNRLCHI